MTKKKAQSKKMNSKQITGLVFEYAPALESTRVELADKYGHFINGAFTKPNSKNKTQYLDSVNPATGEVLSKISIGNKNDKV